MCEEQFVLRQMIATHSLTHSLKKHPVLYGTYSLIRALTIAGHWSFS